MATESKQIIKKYAYLVEVFETKDGMFGFGIPPTSVPDTIRELLSRAVEEAFTQINQAMRDI